VRAAIAELQFGRIRQWVDVERATFDALCVDTAATALSRVETARLLAVRPLKALS
jgi:hypothetical protein